MRCISLFSFLLIFIFNKNINVVVGDESVAVLTAEDDVTTDSPDVTTVPDETTSDTCQTGEKNNGDEVKPDTNGKSQDNLDQTSNQQTEPERPIQSGPLVDLFGEQLLSIKMVDETHAQLETHYTNEILAGKKVIGVYFSADWCGPCRQFTPELVAFYDKMNARRGKKDQFEIVWVSRCRDVNSFGQYFTHMKWLALPPEEAMGKRGQMLGDLLKVKGIPHLVLLDELGNVITYDARNKIPTDRAGIGFPWRNPLAQLYIVLVPKSFRLMIKSNVDGIKSQLIGLIQKK